MQFNDYPCSNCNQPLNLSLIVGQPHIQPNTKTCHICHQPYGKIKKYNSSVFSERLPDVTEEELNKLKPQKIEILSGDSRACHRCKRTFPIERFSKSVLDGKTKFSACRECISEETRKHYPRRREKHLSIQRLKRASLSPEEKSALKARERDKRKQRESENPEYYKLWRRKQAQKNRLIRRVRNRLSQFLKGEKKGSTANMIGCSQKELISHLESKFMSGMSWDNYGYGPDKWVIDHIKPMHMFNDGTGNKDVLKPANHYTNLQPLWFDMNDAKNGHYDPDHPMGWHGLDKLLIERGEPTPWLD